MRRQPLTRRAAALITLGVVATAGAACGGKTSQRAGSDVHRDASRHAAPRLSDATSAKEQAGQLKLGCAARVEGTTADGQRLPVRATPADVAAGPVIFSGLRRARRASKNSFARRGERLKLWKAGISVRAPGPVSIRVTPASRAQIAFVSAPSFWRQDDARAPTRLKDGQRQLVLAPCSPDQPSFTDGKPLGRWTSWANGFLVAHPGCATITIQTPARRSPIRLSVGFGARHCAEHART